MHITTITEAIKHFISGLSFFGPTATARGMLTHSDGATDLSRVLGAMAVTAYIFWQSWALVVLKQPFDASAAGGGFGGLLGGAGVLILAHSHSP